MEAEAAPEVASAQLLLDFELAVLRALPGATSVADFPAGGVEKVKLNDPNSNGVRLKIGGRLIKQTFNANISDKIQAARVLKDRLKDDSFFGEAAVLAAEEQVRLDTQPSHQLSASSASAELTEAELQWLAEWYDEQPEPDQVAIEQADAALQRHRASSGGSSATQVLFEAQWLRAKLTAATTRMQKAAREVERFKHEIDARQVEKRQRLDEPVRPPNWKEYKEYSQSTYQKLESEEQNRRAVPIDRSIFDHNLPSGDETRGWRRHWRRSVPGCLRSWAAGSLGAIIFMLAACAQDFDVVEEVGQALGFPPKVEARHAETCVYIVGRLRSYLSVAKWAKTEEQRQDVHVVLGAAAPRRKEGDTDPDCMIERVAETLGVTPGKRYHKASGTQRPRVYEQAVTRRSAWDAQVAAHPLDAKGCEMTPWAVSDAVLCRGQPGTLHALGSGDRLGGCTVAFEVEGEKVLINYESFGTGKGGARLQRPPPSLHPPAPASSKGYDHALRARVLSTYHAECATSPHASDTKRKRLAPHVYIKAQALVILSDLKALYNAHLQRFPSDKGKIGFSGFKELKPWYAVFGGRETCLCKWCENFKCYQDGLKVAVEHLKPLLTEARDDGDDDGDDDAGSGNQAPAVETPLAKLVRVFQLQSKQMICNEFVCGGDLNRAERDCYRCTCGNCGIKKLWSQGLRKDLVDASGKLKPGADKVWLTPMKWECISSGKSPAVTGQAAGEQDELRKKCEGTIIDLFDGFEDKVMRKFPFHRRTLIDAKNAEQEREDNMPPGVLDGDSDYSESGPIANAREIQSEYWKMKRYTLFVSIWSYLLISAWLDRCGRLAMGDEVTVEPEDTSTPDGRQVDNGLVPPASSFFAIIEEGSSDVGEGVLYRLRGRDGVLRPSIPRARLRLRRRRTVAFACVSNEMRHDAPSTQHFLNRILHYFMGHPTTAPAPPPPAPPPPPYQFEGDESFWALVHKSDNATHFKSGRMLNYWTRVKANPPLLYNPNPSAPPLPPLQPPDLAPSPPPPPPPMTRKQRLSMLWVDFGCPGHGKGPWDGLGAMLKQRVRRDILHNQIRTTSGFITSPAEVAEHLYNTVSTEEWKADHTDKKVNEIVVLYSNATDMELERTQVERWRYDTLDKQKETFSYLPLAEGIVARREGSCWCPPCFGVRGVGSAPQTQTSALLAVDAARGSCGTNSLYSASTRWALQSGVWLRRSRAIFSLPRWSRACG